MSDRTESLLVTTPQPELLPAGADVFFAEPECSGEFTGERLFAKRPDTYKAIVVLLAQKMGVIRIGKLLSVSPNTVLAVRDREGASVDIVKEHLARVAHAGATLASEGILNALSDILQRRSCLAVKDLKELAVVYGILVQNGQLLSGQPTARIEVQELRKPDHEDFNAYIRSLPQAQVIHLEGETSGPKGAKNGAENGAEHGPNQPAPGGLEVPGTDEQSEGNAAKP
jgi:hypothetical protein